MSVRINDRIVEFLRENPAGVSSREIAERFLRLRGPVEKLAARLVTGVLAEDRRCVLGADGLWRAITQRPRDHMPLRDLPWSAVRVLSQGRRLMHISAWTLFPQPHRQFAFWLSTPEYPGFEEPNLLNSPHDEVIDESRRDDTLAWAANQLSERVLLFLTMNDESLLGWHCSAAGAVLTDNTMAISHLFRAAGLALPRPLDLASCCERVLGRRPLSISPAEQGRLLAECGAELVSRLEQAGVETWETLSEHIRGQITTFDFSGKDFTAETLAALPSVPGVYVFRNRAGECLYVGKAINIHRRVSGYFRRSEESPPKLERLRTDSVSLSIYPCGSELECLLLEHRLIRKHRPHLNTQVEIAARPGTYRPLDNCVALLPHADPAKGMSMWFRQGVKVTLVPFDADGSDIERMTEDLQRFFFGPQPTATPDDRDELEIAERWLKRHADDIPLVSVSRMGSGKDIATAMRVVWHENRG